MKLRNLLLFLFGISLTTMPRISFCLAMLIFSFAAAAQTAPAVPQSEDSLAMFLKKQPKDTLFVWALRPYALIQINKYADYERADSLANEMLTVSEKLNYGRGKYFHYLIKAIIHNQKTESQLSLDNFRKSYEMVKKYKLPVSLEEASLNNIAIAYEQLGNPDKALEYAMRAIKVQEQPGFPEKWLDAGPYGLVSGIYKFKKQYEQAVNYSKLAYSISEKKQNLTGMAIQKNKLGNIYDDMERPDAALQEYRKGLELAEEAEYPLLQTDLLSNIGRVLLSQKKYTEAEAYLKRNEALCETLESPYALETAYLNLGDYYQATGKQPLALAYFKKAYTQATRLDNHEKKFKAALKLAESYRINGDYRNAYTYLTESNSSRDSLFTAESDEKMQELLTRYETEKKEAAIAQLENEKRQANLRFTLLTVLGVLALISAILLFRNYRSGQRIKALEATQKLRNRISADLHDEIGSTLSSISILSEMLAIQPKTGSNPVIMQQISTDARKVIEKMDEIIWTINPNNDEFLNLEARLKSYAVPLLESRGIDFEFDFSDGLENQHIEMEQRKEIYLILKEALNNAIKYSGCSQLRVTGYLESEQVHIRVADNGKGFDPEQESSRTGLRNMKLRAQQLQGTLGIESRPGEGTSVILRFPVS